jgi:branched-chain amino acid aminotransferase
MKIYINGKYYSKEDASVSVFDHGLLYGDGVFEGIRIYNGTIFKLQEHLLRLYDSARAIMLDIGLTINTLENDIRECVRLNEKMNGYIRVVVTRGEGALGIDPSSCKNATVIIIVGDIQLYPEEYYTKGISLIISSYQRIPSACFDVRIKSLNYLNNILAKIEARQAGCFECILLNKNGHVAECTADNIFFVKNGSILTPSVTEGALDGITRRTVLDLAKKAGIETAETTLSRFDCYTADECFLTGTGAEIIPVVSIDHRVIGNGQPGAITQNILRSFTTFVRSIA